MENLNCQFDVIGLSETWLNDSKTMNCTLDNYLCEHLYRKDKIGGGVSILFNNQFKYVRRNDLTINCEYAECLFIEILNSVEYHCDNVLVGVAYRPPNTSIEQFVNIMSPLLDGLRKESKPCYLMGDFNINLLNADSHVHTGEFLEMMYSNSFTPLITKPTRITPLSATLIDNIYTTFKPNRDCVNGILCSDVSDHFPIFSIDQAIPISREEHNHCFRQYNESNISKFLSALDQTEWTDVTDIVDCQQSFSKFHGVFKEHYDNCFPLKKRSDYKNRCKWLTLGLRKSIQIKNKLYIKSLKFPSKCNKQLYKQYKQKLRSIMRKCERDYYEKEFNANKCNMRRQWQLIKSVINNKTHNKISDVMSIKGTLVNDPKLISNSLNQFYLNIGKNKGPVSNISYNARSFMNQPCSQSFFIRETTEIEVKDIIQNLKNNSCGWDEVSSNVLKRCNECILKPLVYLLNLSLSQGIVPTECKIARVTPLYKGGDKTNMSNYRPISVLPVFSKILERIMHVRLVNYFEKYKILYDLQFGFRKGHSTQLALSYLINKLVSSYENNNYVLGLFLDFSKAFDMVNHDILLHKLEYYGVRGIGLKWMKNYLNNRYQYVYYNGVKSEMGSISCGVPQGSILGPLLFLVYINDIANVTNDCQPILYADDTNMFVTGKDIDVMIARMNDVMQNIVQCLNVNRLA